MQYLVEIRPLMINALVNIVIVYRKLINVMKSADMTQFRSFSLQGGIRSVRL